MANLINVIAIFWPSQLSSMNVTSFVEARNNFLKRKRKQNVLHPKITIFFEHHIFSRSFNVYQMYPRSRVAELGSLSSGAKMVMKIFVKRLFTIFAINASFLRVIANLQN